MVTETPLSYWAGFHLLLALLFVVEFFLLRKSQTVGRAVTATVMWLVAALGFGGFVAWAMGRPLAVEFLSGYAIEESLSVDNLFVFLLLFRSFAIEGVRQRRVLFWGILGAVVMRGGFIAAGIELLKRFEWVTYVFGAVLLIAAVRLVMPEKKRSTAGDTPKWVQWISRVTPISMSQDGFMVREDGRMMPSMLMVALIAIAFTDFVFALDSIPAVLSITRHPFIAYSSNVMAVMGLRSLYFLLAHLLERLHYLHYGLAAVLAFAALKMLLERFVEIGPGMSLVVIVGLLGVTIAISLMLPRKHEAV